MKKILLAVFVSALVPASIFAAEDLDGFLRSVNIQARADPSGFSAKVSLQFGVPEAQVKVVLGTVREPADAFMVFQLGRMLQQPPDKVLKVYQAQKGKGWGALAQELGIKPGSAEFHALKRGDFQLGPASGDGAEKGKGKGKGKQGKVS